MLLKFYHKSLRCWMHLSSSIFYYFNHSNTECSFAYLLCRYFVEDKTNRRSHKVCHNLIYNRLFSNPSHLIWRCKSIHLIACSSWKFDAIATMCSWDHEWQQWARYPMRHRKGGKNLHKLCRYSVVKCWL